MWASLGKFFLKAGSWCLDHPKEIATAIRQVERVVAEKSGTTQTKPVDGRAK